ncbi:hypothetical protein C8R46DRAFT_983752 [Mycena filopes]|nr:hypothetical protein C8R46DRAFT_983752 [Mycena filopes]
MDRKLDIPEILDLIIDHIGPVDHFLRRRDVTRNLAALARTCKAFQSPASDALWIFQYNLVPVLRSFPDDIWDRPSDEDPKNHTFLRFSRALEPVDWERPITVLRRIKTFRFIHPFDTERISLDVCETLRICCPTATLFPNLREICWADERPSVAPVFSLFLAPRLYSIGLNPWLWKTPGSLSLLSSIGAKYPDLTELDLTGAYLTKLTRPVLRSVLVLLSGLHRLASLDLPNTNAAILEHIAHLPCLKSLTLSELVPLVSGSDDIVQTSEPLFPALQDLALWSTTPTLATNLIASAPHRALTSLGLIFETVLPDARSTARLYSTIAAHCAHSSLELLHVQDEWTRKHSDIPPDEEYANFVVNSTTLRILFPFARLTNVILQTHHGFDLDDDVVSELARSWPRIEELKVSSEADRHILGTLPCVTLLGVLALGRHCPNLHKLELLFNASVVPPLAASEPEPAVQQTSLKNLHVLCSPISAPAAVSAFLSDVFPNLRDIHSHCLYAMGSEDSLVERDWSAVHKVLRRKLNS